MNNSLFRFAYLTQEIRSVQLDEVQDNDEMEISDDDENYGASSNKRTRIDNDNLKV